ncbi:hypothetical protein L202_07951 [Cryptococcus amylolentus CBS 6039]|uniref:HECT-type E3 ubiquitin transferase n=3 Tax=Cryptococcus amylolentus CBS 6039 TaxID=1295533 RepID=A0A1E3HCC8_9TREE|nr:hypothetical protein L202_07951 [Cryptococcus amylolentus CBS 6039]ODN73426.1 hypothetical protein L202_07951 [Cryptococcus amylolentus CBS 6039]
MKVKKSNKKQNPPPDDVAALINKISSASDEEIAEVLEQFQAWRYPRGDLHTWVLVLDRFDEILAGVIQNYDLTKLQLNDFTPKTKKLLLEVLRVQRLLLENCTNRKLFNSYDRLSDLLLTNDLDVLQSAIFVLLRPAQQYAITTPLEPAQRHAILHRLVVLSRGWESLVHSGINLTSLASDQEIEVPNALRHVQVSFYPTVQPTGAPGEKSPTKMLSPASVETPTRQRSVPHSKNSTPMARQVATTAPALSGPSLIDLGDVSISMRENFVDQLSALAEREHIPLDDQYSVLNRLRLVLLMGDRCTRRRLLSIRLLALATYVYLSSEDAAQSNLFLYEPEMVSQLADLMRSSDTVGEDVTTGALIALCACAHHQNKMGEVMTSVSVNVNHGVMVTFLRRLVQRSTNGDTMSFEVIDATMAFIAYLATSPSHSNMLMGAGILRLLLEMLKTTGSKRETCIPRATGLIDSIIFSNPQGLSNFSGIDGVNALVLWIKSEIQQRLQIVDEAPSETMSEETILAAVNNPLKSVLRSIQRLMQASGGTEGLRNLVDSDLPRSLKVIFQNSSRFGPRVFALAINTMATFVHNEPTSLSILQEMQLPQTLYDELENDIPPSSEVLSSLSNAVGAVCLNQAGLDYTVAHPGIISNLVYTVVSPRHEQIFNERDNAKNLGLSLDELARHHPSLRPVIITAVIDVLKKAHEFGATFEPKDEERLDYLVDEISTQMVPSLETQPSKPAPTNKPLAAFTRVFKMLSGLLRNATIVKDFVNEAGLDTLMLMTDSPCWPIRFGATTAAMALAHLMKYAIESCHAQFLDTIIKSIEASLGQSTEFWMVNDAIDQWQTVREGRANDSLKMKFRVLQSIAVRLTLFGDALYALSGSNPKVATAVIKSFNVQNDPAFIQSLGKVHRLCFRFHVLSRPPKAPPVEEGATPEQATEPGVRYLSTRLHAILSKFFKCLVRLIYIKRGRDQAHQEQGQLLSACVADILIDHLSDVRDSLPDAFAIDGFALGTVLSTLFDGRGLEGHLNTSLFLVFERKGGFDKLLESSRRIVDHIDHASTVPLENRSQGEKDRHEEALQALKTVLFMCNTFVSTRALLDSPETHALASVQPGQAQHPFAPTTMFLKLRLAVFPLARHVWEASWLLECPTYIIKAVVNCYSTLMEGKHEEPLAIPAVASRGIHIIAQHHRPPVVTADSGHIDQLVDMGFPRGSATQALVRARNNVAAATDLLLTVPHEFDGELPAPPHDEAVEEVVDDAPAPVENAPPTAQDAEVEEPAPVGMGIDVDPAATADDINSFKQQLHDLRDKDKGNLAERALAIVDVAEDLVMDLLSCLPSGKEGAMFSLNKLLDICREYQEPSERIVSARLRLTSVCLRLEEGASIDASVFATSAAIIACLPLSLVNHNKPRWLTGLLLFGETLLSSYDTIVKVKLGDDSSEPVAEPAEVLGGVTDPLFRLCSTLVSSDDASREELVASLRLLVLLSRSSRPASTTAMLSNCLKPFRKISGKLEGCYSLLAMIIRHLVDDKWTLNDIIDGEVRSWLSPGRSKVVDIQHFVKQLRPIALREPSIFVNAVEKECTLVDPTPSQSVYHIRSQTEEERESGVSHVSSTDTGLKESKHCQDVIDVILSELSEAIPGALSKADSPSTSKGGDDFDIFSYSSLLMATLTELLGSYLVIKKTFLASLSQRVYPGGIKSKGGVNGVINDMVCCVMLTPDVMSLPSTDSNSAAARRLAISSRATAMIVALCSDTTPALDKKDTSEDMVSIRKTVLDAISKAIRDTSLVVDVNVRYGRLWALGELIHRLLVARSNASARQINSSGLHMAKTMLEKNYVGLLTNALGEIDLNYPDIRNVLVTLLRALDHLSKLSVKWGKANKDTKDSVDERSSEDDDDSDSSNAETDSDVDMLDEDQAPDLYRNSALGMLGGELGEDDEDDEMDEEEDEDDMEMGDDLTDDDDDTATQTSEDESMASVLDHDEWTDGPEDDLGDSDDEGDLGELEPEVILGSAEEDGEMWEGESDGHESFGTDEDEDADGEGVHAEGIFDDGFDDPEMEEFDEDDDGEGYDDAEIMEAFPDVVATEATGPWGWVQPGRSRTHDPLGSHRLLPGLSEDELLGASNAVGPSGRPAQHPLLPHTSSTSGARQLHRSLGGNFQELVTAIERLGGADAIHMLENVLANRHITGSDATWLSFTRDQSGNLTAMSVNGRTFPLNGNHRSNAPPGHISAEFVPMTTLQRWGEELNLAPLSRTEGTSRLVLHLINRLLPEARRRAEELRKADEATATNAPAVPEVTESTEDTEDGDETAEVAEGGDSAPISEGDVDMSDTEDNTSGQAADDVERSENVNVDGPRTLISIHGREVDITDAGIDLEFLQALPDDMRADVVEQHLREQRQHQRPAASANIPEPVSQINSEFLEALPPDIRAEVIMQEAMESERRNRPQPPLASGPSRTFLSSIANQLRGVLGTQGEGSGNAIKAERPDGAKGRHREALQLLEKSGIAVLVRLLFFPHALKKSSLFKVLVNLCENSNTRNDLLDLLISVVHDGSGDLPAVDRSFQQMSLRGTSTPKATPKGKAAESPAAVIPSSLFSHLQAEHVPTFITQRCFEALAYIVTSNAHAASYFLSEHEQTAGLRKHSSKKSKGKEKSLPQTKFPIVILLGLLDRPVLAKTPGLMDTVTALLLTVTKPLAERKAEGDQAKSAVAAGGDSSASADDAARIAAVQSAVEPTKTLPHGKGIPSIPAPVLRLIVNCLTSGDCTSRTFSQTLGAMQNLSNLPEGKDVILQELCLRCRDLGHLANEQLQELVNALEVEADVGPLTLISFSPPSSAQAQLLRLLKTIDYLHLNKVDPDPPSEQMTSEEQAVTQIFGTFDFGELWEQLGRCLSMVEARGNTEQLATVLLPLVEALMVISKYKSHLPRDTRSSSTPPSSTESADFFVTFTTAHRKVLNTIVRNNPSLLSGSFSLLIRNPRVLEFDNKRTWFFQKLKKKKSSIVPAGPLHLNVRRQYVFEDSFSALQRWSGEELKYGKLSVKFRQEDGVDAGGVTREWYSVLAQQIFDPNFALFEPCAADQQTYQPNKMSWINDVHLSYFKFVGRVIGKAVYDGRLLDAYFNRAFYKQILGRTVDMRDLESIDPEYHKSLQWMLNNDITGIIDQEFTTEDDQFGEKKTVELKPDGANIPVTEDNKEEYVRLVVSYRLDNSIRDQIKAFLEGFYDIIPHELIQIFEPDQLELLISGITTVDVDELKNATQLSGWKSTDPEISWFWRALRIFSQEERSRFLMFVTSSSRVPLGGFAQLQGSSGTQPFQIQKLYGKEGGLPQASTCFNLLLLPTYTSYEQLRERLQFAITETGGFGKA